MIEINHEKIEITRSQRNKPILLYEGYSYRKRYEISNAEIWRCRVNKCSGVIKTSKDGSIIFQKEHNHLPNFADNEALYISGILKKRAVDTSETPRNIINRFTRGVSFEAKCILPKYDNLRKKIGRERNKNNFKLNLESDIIESIKYTETGELFYLYDSGINSQDRVIIFGTETNILHLCSCDIWIADGTFRSCPSNFY
ncbi:hypothetical protein DMUE_3291 [Dictyocoela muelleri]|nr:hypothetical protein DMUE_3291 [Dictyocoela muelleri]